MREMSHNIFSFVWQPNGEAATKWRANRSDTTGLDPKPLTRNPGTSARKPKPETRDFEPGT